MRARVGQHAAGLLVDLGRRAQFPLSRVFEQFRIGHAVPQKVRQPAGNLVLPARAAALGAEQKVGRLQHGFHDNFGAVEKLTSASAPGFVGKERSIALHFRLAQRPAKCLQPEFANETRTALCIGRCMRAARNQTMRIAAPKRVVRQPFSRGPVRLCQERRNALRRKLILEAIHEIFGRELVRGIGFVAQQVMNAVVVLAVRQPAHGGGIGGAHRSRGAQKSQ